MSWTAFQEDRLCRHDAKKHGEDTVGQGQEQGFPAFCKPIRWPELSKALIRDRVNNTLGAHSPFMAHRHKPTRAYQVVL